MQVHEQRALQHLTHGAATADKVGHALSMSREGARKLLERLVTAGALARATVASGHRTQGVASQVVYYHLPNQEPPPPPPGATPKGYLTDRKLLAALAAGPLSVAQLVDATRHTSATVRARLKRLQGQKQVRELTGTGIPKWERVG